MIPTNWTALLLLAVAVLPGAMFTFAFERQAGAFGVSLADRVLRFVAVSGLLAVLYAWPAYGFHRFVFDAKPFRTAQFAVAWCAAVVGLALPAAAGTALGGLYATRGTRTGWQRIRKGLTPERETRLLQAALGRDPAPRAWDHYFSERPTVYLRVRRQDGTFMAGLFAQNSYAGGFPQDGDLLLEQAWSLDEDGALTKALDYSLYIPAGTISDVEIIEPTP